MGQVCSGKSKNDKMPESDQNGDSHNNNDKNQFK